MFISIDPGANTGVATFMPNGNDVGNHTYREGDFLRFLNGAYYTVSSPDYKDEVTWIMEDFNLRQDKALAQTGSDMPASRMIGAVQMVDNLIGAKSKIVYQKPGNLRTALKWAGFPELANKPRSWHCPDHIAAYAHGKMYLIQQGICKHPIFED
jgi:hypothetical protein